MSPRFSPMLSPSSSSCSQSNSSWYSLLNTISRAGGPSSFDVLIRSKSFRSADGSQSDIIADLAFSLAPATFTCMIGPSGCGKTTTLRILLGLETDYDGEIALPSSETRISAVFQEPRLLPWRTVDQNIRLAQAGGHGLDLEPLYQILGLEGLADRYPGELSLGMERRVALARAFAVMPDILLLDEPFVSLDEHTADRLRELLVDLARLHRVTVLMVTHNVREAVRLADRLLLMNGRPARIAAEIAVPLPPQERRGPTFDRVLSDLEDRYPEIIRA
ncbi:ABC transporter ATP-binding protein [Rhizobium sp. EC-SD404]|uniref:ABC transporter ATP-binding protein n=1 Tax=Rhizobium sp. EC-SD404 TaxID=2038389 RepID=UPI00336AC0E0